MKELADEFAIRELVSSFADAASRNDPTAFAATWKFDARWKIGPPFPTVAEGREKIVEAFESLMKNWAMFLHLPHSGVVELAGNRAKGRWLIQEIGRGPDGKTSYHNFAMYYDEYIREELADATFSWRFESRTYTYDWLDDSPIPGRTFGFPPLTPDSSWSKT